MLIGNGSGHLSDTFEDHMLRVGQVDEVVGIEEKAPQNNILFDNIFIVSFLAFAQEGSQTQLEPILDFE